MTISLEPTHSSSQAICICSRRCVELLSTPCLGNYKRAAPELVDGDGVYLIDSTGKRYLDFVSGIAVNALGYGDPGLRAAMHSAADGLIHVSNLYATEPGEQLAAALVNKSFASKVFLCNSGAEANEGAFKFARRWARGRGDAKHEIIALRGAFHGRLFATPAATDRPSYRSRSDRSRPGLGSSSATSTIPAIALNPRPWPH
jgi:acetylornithine/succinyldiaminopimelate/putrescine aminotransferase